MYREEAVYIDGLESTPDPIVSKETPFSPVCIFVRLRFLRNEVPAFDPVPG